MTNYFKNVVSEKLRKQKSELIFKILLWIMIGGLWVAFWIAFTKALEC